MSRLLAIDADLSTPPSSASCWRDVTLRASIRAYEVLAVAPAETQSAYDEWFKRLGLWDYVEDLITPVELMGETVAVQIVGGPNARLTAANLNAVLAYL